ncbi:MAG: hypothetical protein E7Z99_01270 [Coriobacteriaceae bacterium]|nr:hypothetical protein [Coriobacteriaceae bacterium]
MIVEGTGAEERAALNVDTQNGVHRPIARPRNGKEITPEMRALAEALAHPEGDPYDNGRRLGFYCENCG